MAALGKGAKNNHAACVVHVTRVLAPRAVPRRNDNFLVALWAKAYGIL